MFPSRDLPLKASPIKIPSKLKIDTSAESIAVVNATHRAIQQLSPTTRENLTLSQVYSIASDARIKLGREADQVNHNLRRLVGHANMLDRESCSC